MQTTIKAGQALRYQHDDGRDVAALALTDSRADGFVSVVIIEDGKVVKKIDVPHYTSKLVTTPEEKTWKRRRGGKIVEHKIVEDVTRRQAGAFWRV